jgi:predicted glycoside hydrolase/deacetylase ChbG (UPF0249 family)
VRAEKNQGLIPLVINADDFGLTDGVCRAVRELLEIRAISSTSAMVAGVPSRQRCRKWGASHLSGVIGVHLQLTDGPPALPTREVKSLINPETGNFWDVVEPSRVELEEVFNEWCRQVELAAELIGAAPSHLDSHHGVHHLPKFVDAYVAVAERFGLPVRGGTDLINVLMKSNKLRGIEDVLFDWTGTKLGSTALKDELVRHAESSKDPDAIEVVTHPAYCDRELIRTSTLNEQREYDRLALIDLRSDDWLDRNSFVLSSYPVATATSKKQK